MSDKKPDLHELNARLAAFTDKLLNAKSSNPPEIETDNDELRELEETVTLIWETFGQEEPDQAMADRIRQNLIKEWEATHWQSEKQKSFREKFVEQLQWKPVYTVATAIAALVLILLFFLTPAGGQTLPGTARGSDSLVLVIVVAGVVLFGIALWLMRDNE